MFDLSGKTALVTGATGGIGAEIVRAFIRNKAKVAFVDILDPDGEALAVETGALFLHCDITDIPAMRAAVRGWSPVIIITRMPARRASRMARPASSRGGSMMPTVPTKISSRSSVSVAWGSSPAASGR